MLEELDITGENPDKAVQELQKTTTMTLSRDKETGKVTATGEAKTENDKQLSEIITSTSIKVEVNTTNGAVTSEGSPFVGGAFMGNTVTKTESGNTVVAKQEVNPKVLSRMSSLNLAPGQDMLHEVTEAYGGAKISQASGVSSPSAAPGNVGSVYGQAHNGAVPQSGTIIERVNKEGTQVTYSTSPYLRSIVVPYLAPVDEGYKPILVIQP